MATKDYFKTRLRSKGQITIPGKIRELLNVDEGDDLLFRVNEQGQVVIERGQIISADQAWFWTERWQKMEQEVDEDFREGHFVEFSSVEEAIAYLHQGSGEDTNANDPV
ncbi:MAG: AbrB/MazE/SpoVT family DNA-binding domain-containing protein [Anaerolineales bacterium]